MAGRIREREYKSFPALVTKADAELGVIEAIVSVIGNIDLGNDIIHPGAFTKTISERGNKIKILDNHQTFSGEDAIGKILKLQEIGRDRLPDELREEVPDATGGLLVEIQFMLDDPRSSAIFKRIKAGVIDQYSIGFEIMTSDISSVHIDDDDEVPVRNIREIKLWEISPVIFAMNDATSTVSAKAANDNHLDISFDYRDMPMPGYLVTSSDSKNCGTCKHFGSVHEKLGYCKAFDYRTLKNMGCNDYLAPDALPPLVDDFKSRTTEFMNSVINEYKVAGYWDETDAARIVSMLNEVVENVVLLIPAELLSRDSVTKDTESTSKADLWKQTLIEQIKQEQKNKG